MHTFSPSPYSVPLPPVFTFSRHTATAVQIIIDPQEGFHGVYNIFWIERRSLDCKLFTNAQSISGTQTSFTLLNLDPGQEYCVTVSAETSAGVGNHSTAIAVECKQICIYSVVTNQQLIIFPPNNNLYSIHLNSNASSF